MAEFSETPHHNSHCLQNGTRSGGREESFEGSRRLHCYLYKVLTLSSSLAEMTLWKEAARSLCASRVARYMGPEGPSTLFWAFSDTRRCLLCGSTDCFVCQLRSLVSLDEIGEMESKNDCYFCMDDRLFSNRLKNCRSLSRRTEMSLQIEAQSLDRVVLQTKQSRSHLGSSW